MAKKKFDAGALANRAQTAAKELSKKDRAREAEALQEAAIRSHRHLDQIDARPGGDTRPLNAEHVVSLAESIEALGLIEPLVVDKVGHLLAGGHRLAACRLLDPRDEQRQQHIDELLSIAPSKLKEQLQERIDVLNVGKGVDVGAIPVRAFDIDATDDPETALLIETSENTQRRDYTRAEVVSLYKKLIDAGYTDRRGKPRQGEKAAKPVVATVIGKSVRTVRRVLREEDESVNRTNAGLERLVKATGSLERALVRFQLATKQMDEIPEQAQRVIVLLEEVRLNEVLTEALKTTTFLIKDQ